MIKRVEHFLGFYIALSKHEGGFGEFETVVQTRDAGGILHIS